MSVSTVGSSAELLQTLNKAQAGDTILLASGTYSNVLIKNFAFSDLVTIKSQDANAPAILTDLTVRQSEGLQFSNLKFSVDPKRTEDNPFQVLSSKNVHLSNLEVYSYDDGDLSNDKGAVMLRQSSNVSVSNSYFHDLRFGITFLDDDGVTLSGNRFSAIRTDGVRGGGTSNLQIVGNSFTNFNPAESDHPDAIQLWTTNTTASAHDILIANNVITRGSGSQMQGIFVTDPAGFPYQNLTISGNLVVGTLYHGITVDSAANVQILSNTVSGYSDNKAWIKLDNIRNLSVLNNEAERFLISVSNYTDVGNKVIAAVSGAGAKVLNDWLAANPFDVNLPTGTSLPFSGPSGVKATRQVGGEGADNFRAGAGDAWFEGGAGNDCIEGGSGADFLRGDGGDDIMFGGGGDDDMNGNLGRDTLEGGAGADWVIGGQGNDLLYGGTGKDIVYGNIGDDTCYGDADADWLRGGQGNDSLSGGAGDDFLSGDRGADTIMGGGNADTFNYAVGGGLDLILDFSASAGDRIHLDAQTSYSLSEVSGDVVVDFGGGDQIILVGVQLASLTAGWIFAG